MENSKKSTSIWSKGISTEPHERNLY